MEMERLVQHIGNRSPVLEMERPVLHIGNKNQVLQFEGFVVVMVLVQHIGDIQLVHNMQNKDRLEQDRLVPRMVNDQTLEEN